MGKFSNNEAIDIEDRLGDLLLDKSNSETLEIIERSLVLSRNLRRIFN